LRAAKKSKAQSGAKTGRKPRRGGRRTDARILVSAGKFAELCGVHHNTVGNWINEGLPATRVRRQTRIEVAAGVQWVRHRDRHELEDEIAALRSGQDAEGSKAAKVAAEARLKELDLAERQGRLLQADDVEARWTQIVVSVREGVMGVPALAVQAGLILPAQEADLEAICRDVLIALGRDPRADADEAAVA
jgi:phage terminase Nu1 subunit (DNA packaging protein)